MKKLVLLFIFMQHEWVFANANNNQANETRGVSNFQTIGPTGNCHFNTTNGDTLQDAINSGFEEIRLVNSVTYYGAFNSIGSVNIRGGFDTCLDAAGNQQGTIPSEINGDAIGSTLTLAVNGTYQLEKIKITNGLADQPAPGDAGGGLNLAAADSVVILTDVIVEDNVAMFGAGIAKMGINNNTVLVLADSVIQNNQTLLPGGHGGGIYFNGTGEFIAYGDTLISRNEAEIGGGLFLKDTVANLVVGQNAADTGIIANKSTESAAGVYTNNTTLEISGGAKTIPGIGAVGATGKNYLIKDNIADSDNNQTGVGGGLFLYNNSQVTLNAISIIGNQSHTGGGIYSYFSTVLDIGFPSNTTCQVTSLMGCNFFINNQANISGGALYATHNTLTNMTGVNFNNNQAQLATVASAHISSTISLHSSVMYNNYGINNFISGNSLGSYSQSTLNIEHTTAANNTNADSFIQISTGQNLLNSYNNYFYNPQSGPWLETFGSSFFNHECQIVDVNNNLIDSQNHLSVVNANDHDNLYFVDAANNDFHLSDTSGLIDFTGLNCPINPNLFNNRRDIDNQPRTPAADMGADENLINDFIFINGFEDIND